MALSIGSLLFVSLSVFTRITYGQATYFKRKTFLDGYYYCLAEGRERFIHCSSACIWNLEDVEIRFKGYSLG